MRKRIGIVLIGAFFVVAGAFGVTAAAYAVHDGGAGGALFACMQDGAFGRGAFRHTVRDRIARALDLTEEQKREAETILASERPNVAPLIRQLVEGHKRLRAADDGQFHEAQVRIIAAQQAQTLAELIVAKERIQMRLYALLTPEQRAKAERMRARLETVALSRLEDAGLLAEDDTPE
jgi:protein CpxP